MLGNHVKGYRRDKLILEAVNDRQCLSTEQVHILLFQTQKQGLRIAQRRLEALYRAGLLSRWRQSLAQPFYYYNGERKEIRQFSHKIGVNWVYLWTLLQLKGWEKLHAWQYEPQDYKTIRPDAFCAIKNTMDRDHPFSFFFLEYDRAQSGNKFDKIERYNRMFANEEYIDTWWAKLSTRFPPVYTVTTTPTRAAAIKKSMDEKNEHGLEFIILDADTIIAECKGTVNHEHET